MSINRNSDPESPLLDSLHDTQLQELRYKKMQEIDSKVQEIVNLNEYIDCTVKQQGEYIDNVLYRMRMDEARTRNTVFEMRELLGRKKRRKKMMKAIGIGVGIIVVFYMCVAFFKHLLNKFF